MCPRFRAGSREGWQARWAPWGRGKSAPSLLSPPEVQDLEARGL